MRIFFKNFFKGVLIGLLFLPFELLFLTLRTDNLIQAQDLREEIRSQVSDPRDIRGEVSCEGNSSEGCARPIPSHPEHREPCSACISPAPSTPAQPSVQPSVQPTPPPGSVPPGVSPAPGVSPSPGVGGPGASPSPSPIEECEECEAEEEEEEEVEAEGWPQVLGLSYTGSGRW